MDDERAAIAEESVKRAVAAVVDVADEVEEAGIERQVIDSVAAADSLP